MTAASKDNPDPLADLFAEYLDRKRAGQGNAQEEILARCPEPHREALRRSISFVEKTGGGVSEPVLRATPERFGDFRIVRVLGQGGMGVVYEAQQVSMPRKVALKLIAPWMPRDDRSLGRLHREAQAIAKLRHENIVTVFATGEEEGVRYFAMELIPGRGLDELRAELAEQGKSIPIPKLLRWIAQIARALHCAHEAGVVHRDVKPSNILVTPDERVILIDFGLAQDSQMQSAAKSGEFKGSPHYASPEQVAAHREGLGPASDVYSLGATLYECVTGKLPFEGATTEQVFHQILSKEPVSPRAINHLIPRDLETVIQTAMEKEPARRYKTAAAFADDLEALLEVRPIQAAPTSMVTRTFKWARRNRGWAAAIVTGFTATLLTGSALYRQSLVSSTLENYRVALRVREAIAAGREPEAGDKLHLQEILPDPAARTAFLRDPKSPEVWERIQRNLEEMPRSGDEPALVRPRAGITQAQPVFRFRLNEGPMRGKPMQLVLVSEKFGERSWAIAGAVVARGEFAFPPDAEPLEPGAWYRWTVRPQKQPANAPPSSNWAYFQFVDPAERDRLLAELKLTGDAAMDRLLRATVLVAHGLGEEGRMELDGLPGDVSGELEEYRKLLGAEVDGLVNEKM